MLSRLRQVLKPRYEALNTIEINSKTLSANYNFLVSLQPSAEIYPVLKSNAYGHGLKEVCQILNRTKAKTVVVDSFPEAQIVYKNFKGQVLILSEMPLAVYKYCKPGRTEFGVYNLATIKYLAENLPGVKIHLFFNSGMNREGIADIEKFLETAGKWLKKLEVVGFCSHLASREVDSSLNNFQEEKFFSALEILKNHGFNPPQVHLGNSAGIFTLADSRLTVFRAGLAFYGYNVFRPEHPAFGQAENLKPALRFLSTIKGKQNLEAGETVSYNETYRADKNTAIALVPVGYYEGLDRRLSNQAEFKVLASQPFMAKIAGRVCMNLVCLDCGQNEFGVGDQVELFSVKPTDLNSLRNLANISQTIIYELLARLAANIHRELI